MGWTTERPLERMRAHAGSGTGLSELAGRVLTLDAMFAQLNNFLAGLSSPPPANAVDYDGLEYKWGIFVFRPARPYTQPVAFTG